MPATGTPTALRPKSKMLSGTWTDIFPASVEKPKQSFKFIKKLLAVSISNILYLRSSFPEDAFADKMLDDLPLKILNRKSACQVAKNICEYVENAMEAVEKGYLRELILAITGSKDTNQDVMETYTFSFEYLTDSSAKGDYGDEPAQVKMSLEANGDGGPNGDVRVNVGELNKEKDTLYKCTKLCLKRILHATNNMEVLPDEAYLHLKLTYFGDRTPKDYEPVGFEPTEWDFECDEDDEEVKIPSVKTKHHALSCLVKARALPKRKESQQSSNPLSQINTSAGRIVCACNLNKKSDGLILTCSGCRTLQHGVCFLVFSEEQLQGRDHVCHVCAAETDSATCTDPILAKRLKKKMAVDSTCQYRMVLAFCVGVSQLTIPELQKVIHCNANLAESVVEKLIEDGVVQSNENEPSVYKVNRGHLVKTVAKKYLGKNFSVSAVPEKPEGQGEEAKEPGSQSPMSMLANRTQELAVEQKSKPAKRSLDPISEEPVVPKKGRTGSKIGQGTIKI